MKYLTLCTIGFLFLNSLHAQEKCYARFSDSIVYRNQPVKVNYHREYPGMEMALFKLIDTLDFKILVGQEISTNMSIQNGKTTGSQDLNYIFSPLKSGRKALPSGVFILKNGSTITVPKVSIQVLDSIMSPTDSASIMRGLDTILGKSVLRTLDDKDKEPWGIKGIYANEIKNQGSFNGYKIDRTKIKCTSKIDRKRISIGEKVTIEYSVNLSPASIFFPEKELAGFFFVKNGYTRQSNLKPSDEESVYMSKQTKEFILEGRKAGKYIIPAAYFLIAGEKVYFDSLTIKVR